MTHVKMGSRMNRHLPNYSKNLSPCQKWQIIIYTAKVFTQNRKVLHSSTYRLFNSNEMSDKSRIDSQEYVIAKVHKKRGSWVLLIELKEKRLE